MRSAARMLCEVESAVALTPRDFEAATDGPAVSVLEGGANHVDARLSPPPRAEGLVPRLRVVRRLLESQDLPVALLVAPAGYGKTTVLAEWSERDARPFAWVRLDGDDRDPARLLASISGRTGGERARRKGRPHEPFLAAARRGPAGADPAAEVPRVPRTARGARARRLPRPPWDGGAAVRAGDRRRHAARIAARRRVAT